MDRPRTRYVEVSGAEVAYQVVGQGPLSMAMRKSSRGPVRCPRVTAG